MDTLEDDGKISSADVLWRRFIMFDENGNLHGEAMWDEGLGLFVPTAQAMRYLDDGMSSHSQIKIKKYHLSMEHIVDNTDMPQKYICGISALSVNFLRSLDLEEVNKLQFKEDPVPDSVIHERGLCHVIWGTKKLPPNDKPWRVVRAKFLPGIPLLSINQDHPFAPPHKKPKENSKGIRTN